LEKFQSSSAVSYLCAKNAAQNLRDWKIIRTFVSCKKFASKQTLNRPTIKMKKIAIIIPFSAIVIGISVMAIMLKSSSCAGVAEANTVEYTMVTDEEKTLVLSLTASVAIPDYMYFAGERTTFDRFDRRERLDRELNSFTYFHSTTMLLFKRANRIFPVIEPIMREHGLPDDFKYMAVIESSLDPFAISPARAVGLWQFLEATGREHGLEINAYVD
jgi:hypothetical protein